MKRQATATGVLAILIVAACNATISPTASVPQAPPTTSAPSLTPVPGGPTPTAAEPAEFVPPAPACPAPPDPDTVPQVLISIGDGPGIPVTPASSTLMTCTTTSVTDAISSEPTEGLLAHPGDRMIMSLPAGWHFLRWEGSDRPVVGEGANVLQPTDTPDRPSQIEVPVPIRTGDSIVGLSTWVVGADGRIVGELGFQVAVTVD
jgi:hypothetical protein